MNIIRRYDAWLVSAPLRTKFASGFCIFSLCEFNAQVLTTNVKGGADGESDPTLAERVASVDWAQVGGYGCLAVYNAPVMHAYYAFAVARGWSLGARIACNSLLVDPVNISVAVFLSGVNKGLGEGLSCGDALAGAAARWRGCIADTVATGLLVWPPIHAANWLLVPQRYRVLGFNMGSLGWNTFLTWKLWVLEKSAAAVTAAATSALPAAATVAAQGGGAGAPTTPAAAPAAARATADAGACRIEGGRSGAESHGAADPALGSPEVKAEEKSAPPNRCPFRGFFSGEPGEGRCLRPRARPPAACEGGGGGGGAGGTGQPQQLTAADLSRILGSDFLLTGGSGGSVSGGGGGEGEARVVPMSSLVGKTLALYFSAEWCPPCKRFTPLLADLYRRLQARGRENHEGGGAVGAAEGEGGVEFIFVAVNPSSEAAFDAYRATMPWPALPAAAALRVGPGLQRFFGAQGVPWLVTIKPDGTVASANAVGAAYRDPQGRAFPWERPGLNPPLTPPPPPE